uniref:Uncharacterized protein n=1 Tax=Oryzias sinensis TaxID=183150 RepID=A0A8C8DLL7_9TELE
MPKLSLLIYSAPRPAPTTSSFFFCLSLLPHPRSLGEHLTLWPIDQSTVVHGSGMASAAFSVALCHLGKARRAHPQLRHQSHQAIDRFRVACAERHSSISPPGALYVPIHTGQEAY